VQKYKIPLIILIKINILTSLEQIFLIYLCQQGISGIAKTNTCFSALTPNRVLK